MFDKFPDQTRDRKWSFKIGVAGIIVSPLFFWSGQPPPGFIFAVVGLFFLIPPILCGQASFERVKRIWGFLAGFAGIS